MGRLLRLSEVATRSSYAKSQCRCFFFKTEKNDIIKNEMDEILKWENETLSRVRKDEKLCRKWSQKDGENGQGNRNDEDAKFSKTRGKFKRLLIFVTFQSIPIIGLMYLFKYVEDVKLAEMNYSFDTSEEIVRETIKLIDGNAKCFCIYFRNNEMNTFFIDPLNPQESEMNYEQPVKQTTEVQIDTEGSTTLERTSTYTQKAKNENMEQNGDTKDGSEESIQNLLYAINKPLMQKVMSLKSRSELPLNYLYFCVSKNTDIHNFVKSEQNNINLLYSDDKKNVYATLTGNASIIENENIRNVIWTDKWTYLISDDSKENYILIKFTPSTISLKTIGMKNQHWRSNTVRRFLVDEKVTWVKV
ncbi:conserved Plasmodium protein, unknown function [Plasmodium ovale wallikeri]|uniref:Uncharacterized protein n=2 Tax=Plasmodium ovale TaxID=36330 RepID=A0A1A9A279_PLAOA|nr:conserved Plasmodium protein, unknown function [Plasmodium ovale wallikeri]SBT50799.1 conserved Plasmodium protein, unknown function [Plasmodium ovale wallikeri]SBT82784.1 conserved Plasmodium protein, unknown function [Plasmodium ovale]